MPRSDKSSGLLIVAVVILIGVVIWQHREIGRLREALSAVPVSPADPLPASGHEPTADPGPSEELLRLRGEVARLRQQATELEGALNAAGANQARRGAEPEPVPTNEEREAFKQQAIAKMTYAKNWAAALYQFAEKNGGTFPQTLAQAAEFFPQTGAHDDLSPDQFELLYHGPIAALAEPNRVIVLREREPFLNPEGTAVYRTYSFADGHSEIHRAEDGNFDAWEKDRLPNPSP